MLSSNDFEHKQMVFVFLAEGDKINFNNDNIVVKTAKNRIRHQSTCYRLFVLFLIGRATFTSVLLEKAKKFGFSIVFMKQNFKPYAVVSFKLEGNFILRAKQYENKYGARLSKYIVKLKIKNQILALKKTRAKSMLVKSTINKLEEYHKRVELSKKISDKELLGIEGNASKIYFKALFENMNWKGRQPRVKRDIPNLLLDIGYTMMFNFIEALLSIYGFDVYVGFYHKNFYQRKSLVCDMVEPFRPIIDTVIRKAYNLGQIEEGDFNVKNNIYFLDFRHSSKYLKIFMSNILKNKREIFLFIQSYYRAFMRSKNISDYPDIKLWS